MRTVKFSAIILCVLALVGCDAPDHSSYRRKVRHAVKTGVMQEYKEQAGAEIWYWYLIQDPYRSTSPATSTTYYYRSATPVTSFTNVPFTRVQGALPKNVQEEVDKSERLPDEKLTEEQEPEQMEQETTTEEASVDAAESPAETSSPDSSPADSSSSSDGGDSGGSSD